MKKQIEQLLEHADVKINGTRPWDIQVHNEELYKRVLGGGTLALGEAYMDGWWDSEALDQFIDRVLRAQIDKKLRVSPALIWHITKATLTNRQTKERAKIVGKEHYDAGNDLYERMLDSRMIYSCGYWKDATNLEEAQEAKLDLICRKLKLEPGMKLLDIGCGWGGLAKFAAERYEVLVVGVTISKEQAVLAKERCAGLPIDIRLQDYRDITEQFDRVVSVGMFEHVGYKNYREYMEVVHRVLVPSGLTLLHTIGSNRSVHSTDPWIDKYIFRGGMLPSVKQIATASERLFALEDWHNFGTDYDRTLMAWHENFVNRWGEIQDKYSERFYRMWTYYLLICAGSFRAEKNRLWQVVFSKVGSQVNYESVR